MAKTSDIFEIASLIPLATSSASDEISASKSMGIHITMKIYIKILISGRGADRIRLW